MSEDNAISLPLGDNHMDALMQAIRSADICVLYQTPDLIYRWAENLPAVLRTHWREGGTDSDLLPENIAENMETIKLQVLASGQGTSFEVRLMEGDDPLWFRFSIDCHRNGEGRTLGLITTGVMVSELRRREQVLKILLREVSHRSKNLLAIILSIAAQTARFSDTVDGFLKKFQGRVQSLSHSQDLVTDSNWRGALFRDLVHSQAGGYIDAQSKHFFLSGENPYLFPGAALHIGLALHELFVNSVACGALASAKGRVKVSCALCDSGMEEKGLCLVWEEDFPAAGIEEDNVKLRFGSTVLTRIVPSSVNGMADYTIEDGHVRYSLLISAVQFDL
ncbi:MAG: Two component system histidine kinase [Candidatus Tokpelaia hoelldobleri]|uniref:histidine kinase n=1 Tax=Candidatus Tokpelaia hoelldobleri TaxID=1902579 RepID=A0A1U9JWF5_9HYPH|nr:MAG: Two component system histidine kinase [Candidatus Tokpelaia hoelldoblerii]